MYAQESFKIKIYKWVRFGAKKSEMQSMQAQQALAAGRLFFQRPQFSSSLHSMAANRLDTTGFAHSWLLHRHGQFNGRKYVSVAGGQVSFRELASASAEPAATVLLFHELKPVTVHHPGSKFPVLARLPYRHVQAALDLHLAEGDPDSADYAVLGTRPAHDHDEPSAGQPIAPVQLSFSDDDAAVVVADAASGRTALKAEQLLHALNASAELQDALGASSDAPAVFAVGHPRALLMLPSGSIPDRDMSDFAVGRGVLMWHAGHRFDGSDGSRTVIAAGGFKRVGASGRTVYPRVDPVAIMGILHPDGNRILLARQKGFPPGMYSTLAGFVEPGETLEAAVARESAEEAGVFVDPRRVRYVSSQPWPLGGNGMFSQLMLGALAPAENDVLEVDERELEHACWVDVATAERLVQQSKEAAAKGAGGRGRGSRGGESKPEAAATAEGGNAVGTVELTQGVPPAPGRMFLPGPYAIAHHIVAAWVAEKLADKSEAHL